MTEALEQKDREVLLAARRRWFGHHYRISFGRVALWVGISNPLLFGIAYTPQTQTLSLGLWPFYVGISFMYRGDEKYGD